jgi:hypothetical protein
MVKINSEWYQFNKQFLKTFIWGLGMQLSGRTLA